MARSQQVDQPATRPMAVVMLEQPWQVTQHDCSAPGNAVNRTDIAEIGSEFGGIMASLVDRFGTEVGDIPERLDD